MMDTHHSTTKLIRHSSARAAPIPFSSRIRLYQFRKRTMVCVTQHSIQLIESLWLCGHLLRGWVVPATFGEPHKVWGSNGPVAVCQLSQSLWRGRNQEVRSYLWYGRWQDLPYLQEGACNYQSQWKWPIGKPPAAVTGSYIRPTYRLQRGTILLSSLTSLLKVNLKSLAGFSQDS